jgi:Phosphopantetheinyl transferase component of siderophore synthetase
MHTRHHTLAFSGFTLHRIDFDPTTFLQTDLLWLPHHVSLARAGRKRRAEHLAGRIAAVHALAEYGEKSVPGIGEAREPVWPAGLHGSISHCGTTALAVAARQPVGIDLETLFSAEMADELVAEIVTPEERQRLLESGLPFPLALTVAFSAKESLYKALSPLAEAMPGFASVRVSAIDERQITLTCLADFSPRLAGTSLSIAWVQDHQQVITLAAAITSPGK